MSESHPGLPRPAILAAVIALRVVTTVPYALAG